MNHLGDPLYKIVCLEGRVAVTRALTQQLSDALDVLAPNKMAVDLLFTKRGLLMTRKGHGNCSLFMSSLGSAHRFFYSDSFLPPAAPVAARRLWAQVYTGTPFKLACIPQ